MNRNIWILEEKELLQEVSGMGELSEPWHSKQVELLDRHLQLLHLYSQAKQNLENQKGILSIVKKKNILLVPLVNLVVNYTNYLLKRYTFWVQFIFLIK